MIEGIRAANEQIQTVHSRLQTGQVKNDEIRSQLDALDEQKATAIISLLIERANLGYNLPSLGISIFRDGTEKIDEFTNFAIEFTYPVENNNGDFNNYKFSSNTYLLARFGKNYLESRGLDPSPQTIIDLIGPVENKYDPEYHIQRLTREIGSIRWEISKALEFIRNKGFRDDVRKHYERRKEYLEEKKFERALEILRVGELYPEFGIWAEPGKNEVGATMNHMQIHIPFIEGETKIQLLPMTAYKQKQREKLERYYKRS